MIKRVLNLLKENNMTENQLVEKLNINNETIAGWKIGKTNPSIYNIIQIAQIFDVTTDYLLTGTNLPTVNSTLSQTEQKLFNLYFQLDELGKYKVTEYLRAMTNS